MTSEYSKLWKDRKRRAYAPKDYTEVDKFGKIQIRNGSFINAPVLDSSFGEEIQELRMTFHRSAGLAIRSCREVGKMLGVTGSAINFIERRALRKLRVAFERILSGHAAQVEKTIMDGKAEMIKSSYRTIKSSYRTIKS